MIHEKFSEMCTASVTAVGICGSRIADKQRIIQVASIYLVELVLKIHLGFDPLPVPADIELSTEIIGSKIFFIFESTRV